MVLPATPPRASHARHDDLEYEVLSLLENEPSLPQREMALRLGASLGRINACLRGMIAADRLRRSGGDALPARLGRAYEVTALGAARRAELAQAYLLRKQAELLRLAGQIEAIQGGADPDPVKIRQ